MKKAGKKVKTFETQKLVKKLKDLRCVAKRIANFFWYSDSFYLRTKDDTSSVKDIEEQLAYLKV